MQCTVLKLPPNQATLTCYVQDSSAALSNAEIRPAALIFPGGGYQYCSDREAEPVARDIQELCRACDAYFVIDDRVELVKRLHVDGVHLGKLDMPVDEARAILEAAPGVKVVDEPAASRYPMPLETSDQDLIYVGRIRRDLSAPEGVSSLTFWCCGDQIRKGAATNAVQIAEHLV